MRVVALCWREEYTGKEENGLAKKARKRSSPEHMTGLV